METRTALRIEIIIEAPARRRLTEALDRIGVTGYTVLPVLGGSGRSGTWSADGQVTDAGGMVAVICIVRPERRAELVAAAFAVVERHIGILAVSPCEVVRAERF